MSEQSSPRLGLLTAIRLAANGSFRFLYPFLPVVARDLGLDEARAGLLVAAIALGGMTGPLTRRLMTGDREQARNLLLAAAALLAFGTLVAAGAPIVVVGVIGFLLLGAGKPLLDTATISYVSQRTPYGRRARATSTMELTWAGALVVVMPLAGLAAAVTSWRVPLAILAVLVLGLGLVAGRVMDRDPRGPRPPRRWSDRVRLPSTARWFLLVVALVFAALEATFSVFGVWLEDVHHVSVGQLGVFAALTAVGELGGSAFVMLYADRIGKARSVVIGLGVCSLGLLGLAVAGPLPLALITLGVGLFGSETAIVAAISMGSEVEPVVRTRFLTTMFATTSFTRALVGGIGPAVYAAAGIRGNVGLSVAAAVGGGLLLRVTVRRDPRLAA